MSKKNGKSLQANIEIQFFNYVLKSKDLNHQGR